MLKYVYSLYTYGKVGQSYLLTFFQQQAYLFLFISLLGNPGSPKQHLRLSAYSSPFQILL
jgi:hypothetical protein